MQIGGKQMDVSCATRDRVLERAADQAFVALFEERSGLRVPVEVLRRGPDGGKPVDSSSEEGTAIACFILFVYSFDRYVADQLQRRNARSDHGTFAARLLRSPDDVVEGPPCN